MLRKVAATHQVFAITHLPQIAARAHRHMIVTKGAKAGVTMADVAALDETERVPEIARMLGGDPESATSRAHAAELLSASADSRSAPRSGRGKTSADRDRRQSPPGA
jgi:DNA repair protein RecN (Recombination protein N)